MKTVTNNQNRTGVAVLIPEKINFNTKTANGDKKGHFRMIYVSRRNSYKHMGT